MEQQSPTAYKKRIGELLIEAGIIRSEELPVGLREARDRSLRLGEVLVMLRYLSAEDLESVLQAQTRLSDGSLTESCAIEALKVASTHRLSFEKALEKVEKDPKDKQLELVNLISSLDKELHQAERVHGPSNREIATICLRMGDLLLQIDDPAEAENCYRRALQILERSFGQRNLKVANCLSRLADLQLSQNRYADAETLYWRVLDITQGAWGTEHLEVAKCQNSLARLFEAQGRFKEAEQFYLSSLRIIEKVGGPDHPDLTYGLRHLAGFWGKQGKRPERRRLGDLLITAGLLTNQQLQEALQMTAKTGRPLGQALVRLHFMTEDELRPALQAQLLIGDGVLPVQLAARALRLSRQRFSFEDALQELGWEPDKFTTHELRLLITAAEELMSAEVALGAEHAGVAILSLKLADIYTAQGKYLEAEPLYRRAIGILEKFFGPKDSEVATGLYKMAHFNFVQGKLAEAERLLWSAVEIRQHVHGPNHRDVAECLESLAEIQEKQFNLEQAVKHYQSALSIREAADGRTNPRTVQTLTSLAELYCQQKRFGEAENLYMRLLRARQKECGPLHGELAPLLEKLGDLYYLRKEFGKAETQFELALEIHEQNLQDPKERVNLIEKYAILLETTGRIEESRKMKERMQIMKSEGSKS